MISCVPPAIVFAGILFWHISADIETVFPRVICAVACLAAIRAAHNAGYLWVGAFGGLAVLFNPFSPDMVSRIAFSGLYFLCVSTALLCLAAMKGEPQKPALALMLQRRIALDDMAARPESIEPEELPLAVTSTQPGPA
jgi:hypothetical protein